MNLTNFIADFFSQSEEQTKDESPEEVCEPRWGYERYNGKIRILFRDKQIDVNGHRARYMFIKKFVVNHIDGQRFIKAQIIECEECENG